MATIDKRIGETDFSALHHPRLSKQDASDFEEGIRLFNSGKFWESHEAWEQIWRRHAADANRLFFQGLIQSAAGLHQLQRRIYHGADKHFRNALWKLRPFRPICLEMDVARFVGEVEVVHQRVVELGPAKISQFSGAFPRIHTINSRQSGARK